MYPSLCCARPNLNAHVRTFVSYVESLKLHNLYLAAFSLVVGLMLDFPASRTVRNKFSVTYKKIIKIII